MKDTDEVHSYWTNYYMLNKLSVKLLIKQAIIHVHFIRILGHIICDYNFFWENVPFVFICLVIKSFSASTAGFLILSVYYYVHALLYKHELIANSEQTFTGGDNYSHYMDLSQFVILK